MKEINFFRRFDRSSKLLILLSILGIVASLVGLRWTFFAESQNNSAEEVIARITLSRADTRVKRSGNMHWYQISEQISCYQDDMVFTGEDSTATIEFPSGDKIYLLPHSLVSISSQLVSLESGAIEVDLSGKQTFSLETLGKVVELKEPSRFKVVQTEKERKVIPIKGKAPSAEKLGVTELKPAPRVQEVFEIIRPRAGEVIPSFPGSKLVLEWRYTGDNQKFVIDVDGKQQDVTGSRFELKRETLPPGKVIWKITNSSQESQESFFEINDQFLITLNYPEAQQELSLEDGEKRPVEFGWSNPMDQPQKFELALEASFSQPLVSQSLAKNRFLTSLPAGQYFWRVGYLDNGQVAYWSGVSNFKISAVAAPTLAFRQVPEVWDFSLNPLMQLEADVSQDVEKALFKLEGPIRLSGKIVKNVLKLKNLKDGAYKIQLFGIHRKRQIQSEIYEFQVKNSKPLEPPKIKNSKIKLFVKALNTILNLLLPSAHADASPKFPLRWDGEANSSYELEIWNEDKSRKILQKKTKTPAYDFEIPNPGKYFWRVRESQDESTGPFSEFAEIEAQDKVQNLKTPLMKKAYSDGKNVTFTWNEPHKEFDYYLEIYKSKSRTPILSIKVKGGLKTFDPRLSDDKYYWRIKAVSMWGNQNPNRQKLLLKTEEKNIEKSSKDKNLFILRAAYFMTSSSYDQEPEDASLQNVDQSLSLAGSSYQIRAELWPKKWNQKFGLHGGYRQHSLSSAADSLTETEFVGEAGVALKRSRGRSHFLFGGFNYSSVAIDFDGTTGNYTKSYGTIRYQFQQTLFRNFSFTLDTTLLQSLQFALGLPSFRLAPMLNWHFHPRWSVSAIAGYEKNQSNPEYNEQGLEGELKITNSILTYGLMLNWSSF